jgi:pimeloyl-ACP methyl ester carboxylesterase
VSSVKAADEHRWTHSSAYTAAVFSETRYAMNGDLRVAYRASPKGERDIVFVPNWFTCCEHLPELPPLQGWVEAMTSLGRVIFFDQPGSGASDPVEPGALPTLEQWADSITAVLDDLESREAVLLTGPGAFAPGALFAATYPARRPRSLCWRGTPIRLLNALMASIPTKSALPWQPCGAGANTGFRSIPTCHGTRRSAPRLRDMTGLPRAHEPTLS